MGWVNENQPELPFQTDCLTSEEAAENAAANAEQIRERVYKFLKEKGIHGATDDEIQVGLGLHVSTQVPRRRELVLSSKVMESGFVRKTRKGCNALVWIASDVADAHPMELGPHMSLKQRFRAECEENAKLRVEIERLHVNAIIKVPSGLYYCQDCGRNVEHYSLLYNASGSALCPRCKGYNVRQS